MCDHVDLAEKLGGAMVIIGAIRGRYADAPSEVIYYQQFHKSMEELIPYAEKKRIVIIFEANDHLETDAYISIKDTAEYIRECGSPCFRLQLDTMHMLYEHEECYQQVLDCADILAQVDISGRDRTCPADGEFPYDQVLKALKESGSVDILHLNIVQFRQEREKDLLISEKSWIRFFKDGRLIKNRM